MTPLTTRPAPTVRVPSGSGLRSDSRAASAAVRPCFKGSGGAVGVCDLGLVQVHLVGGDTRRLAVRPDELVVGLVTATRHGPGPAHVEVALGVVGVPRLHPQLELALALV